MDVIRLDGSELTQRAQAMELLGQALDLPEWWGRNLDALYDCLTQPDCPRCLELRNRAAMAETPFGRRLLRVLRDAAAENPLLELAEREWETG